MAQRGRFYRVKAVPKLLKKSYPLKEVKAGTVVLVEESAPAGSLDVIDVFLRDGGKKCVYSFQLDKIIKRPKTWNGKTGRW